MSRGQLGALHVLELVDPPLGVSLPHLPQGLVLVPALLHILLVDLVHRRLGLKYRQQSTSFILRAHLEIFLSLASNAHVPLHATYLVVPGVHEILLQAPQLSLQALVLLRQGEALLGEGEGSAKTSLDRFVAMKREVNSTINRQRR